MPWYTFNEVWTPLKWIGIHFYREGENKEMWIKIWSGTRKPLFANRVKGE